MRLEHSHKSLGTPAHAIAAREAAGVQYGALPWRITERGFEILLVTTRHSGQWILPKGWPIDGASPHASAEHEALEEAGVLGEIGETAIGAFRHNKKRKNTTLRCEVRIYPLRVTHQRADWPEKSERRARWFRLSDARAAVRSSELKAIIESFGATLRRH